MRKCANFSPYVYKEAIIHIWLCTRSLWISLYMRKIFFSCLSVWRSSRHEIFCRKWCSPVPKFYTVSCALLIYIIENKQRTYFLYEIVKQYTYIRLVQSLSQDLPSSAPAMHWTQVLLITDQELGALTKELVYRVLLFSLGRSSTEPPPAPPPPQCPVSGVL